ncbi:MAG: Nramp family divalent metal transporter [Acidobacteria bacterium]|nr:Nramp family divalent metal transporter [Acidobacteriota bacterium]MDA1234024.1 Nramp family divalent metal transporter [Acidobacteriota bacterium]
MSIQPPPTTLWGALKRIGPSLILTANIVGSGELIMTTALGASVGFVALWVILVSCAVKVVVQLEFGKHAISSGETTLEAFNRLPGPRWRGVSWSMPVWFTVKFIQLIQYGGMIGGVALAMNLVVPSVSVTAWAWACGLTASALVSWGGYRFIERTAVGLTVCFTFLTLLCALLLQWTPYRVTLGMLAEGLSFELPAAAVGVAIAAFGLTGVSADETISYPYWCLEKGYAKLTGVRDGSPEWTARARGWIRVMYVDAIVSLFIYTTATAAFYVLGAAVLHVRGEVPEGPEVIAVLSRIYTETLGPAAMGLFIAGAVAALFSSVFVACASSTRMFTDGFAQYGLMDYSDEAARKRWFRVLAWLLPTIWVFLFLYFRSPVFMVTVGGFVIAILLLLVAFAAYHFRYKRLVPELKPSRIYDAFLWVSIAAILAVGLKAIVS